MAVLIGVNGTTYSARDQLIVDNEDISTIVLNLKPGVDVRGSIRLDGSTREPFHMTDLSVMLQAEDSAFTSAGNPVTRVEGDGSFTLHDVAASEYRLRVLDLPRGVYVEWGKVDGSDALSGPFAIGEREAVLQLRLASSTGHVVSTVVDEKGVAAAWVTVVLVPEGTRRGWADAYVVTTTDASGKFVLNDVPAGKYKAFAWESVPAEAWQYPDFIQRYEERGQRVTIDTDGEIRIVVRLITN
jgi:hypothetical protein